MANEIIKGIRIKGTPYDVNLTDIVSHVTAPNGNMYVIKVNNNGELYTVLEGSKNAGVATVPQLDKTTPKLYINAVYCGGNSDQGVNEHSINYCSHNFVELSNLTSSDIKLDNVILQYAKNDVDWETLHLSGVIKAGSTYLVKGAQCSVLSAPSTKIKIDNYDIEWISKKTNKPITFSNATAKFYLTLNEFNGVTPYTANAETPSTAGYIDLFGVNNGNANGEKTTIDAFEKKAFSVVKPLNNFLFRKYYAMDNVSQANKAYSSRSNAKDWTYVDLTVENGDKVPNIEVYTPKAAIDGKNIFYNKTKLDTMKPSMVTCSFGRQATDNGDGATRCFTWVSYRTDNCYFWLRKVGESWSAPHKAFAANDGRSHHKNSIYNSSVKEYTDGSIVVNKLILTGLTAGVYEYVVGGKNEDNTPNMDKCLNIRKFTVRSNSEVANGFSFVQTSDQQSFNWEEYRVWQAASKYITDNEDAQFMLNTGDMVQNGNRLGEWLDYFQAKSDDMNNMEEVATIGNNDLSPFPIYTLGDGSDLSKSWCENIDLFYTFESDDDNLPIFEIEGKQIYIPSLYSFNYGNVHFMCVNSEIKQLTEEKVYEFGDTNYGKIYPEVKKWCEKDIENDESNWRIAYCHEMPFTLMTSGATENPSSETKRGGKNQSNLNINAVNENVYWFSEFCQKNGIRLVMGGHKHTQATSWPVLENVNNDNGTRTVDSMHPIIVVTDENKDALGVENGLVAEGKYKYPDSWVGDSSKDLAKQMCTFKMLSELDGEYPVIYAMSQATGYKHTSNKELPGRGIPWLRYYYPCTTSHTVNTGQRYPFYTIWTIKNDSIEGKVQKIKGVFNSSGEFSINTEWDFVKNGTYSENGEIKNIAAENGLTDGVTGNEIIRISK